MVFDIAAANHAKPGQIALAWLLHKGADIVPIPGTKRKQYLEENVAAENIRLESRRDEAVGRHAPPRRISGPRYNACNTAMIDR